MGYWPAANGYNNFAVNAGSGQMPPNWSVEHYLVLEFLEYIKNNSIRTMLLQAFYSTC